MGEPVRSVRFRLAALVAIHERESHALAMPSALGDGALLTRLKPLEHTRRALIDMNYRFAPRPDITGIHSMFPVLELTEILRTRTIPYHRTALAARRVLADRPDLRLSDVLFRGICSASYSFHEGAHAIFYETACAQGGVPRGRRFVEVMLASEAFAMAFEQFVALLAVAEGRRSTALFLAVSAYSTPFDLQCFDRDRPGVVARLAQLAVAAPGSVITMLTCSYMVALLRPTATAGHPDLALRLAEYAQLPQTDQADRECLMSIGLHVDHEFRCSTQDNFYGYLGFRDELQEVRSAPLEFFMSPGTPIERCLSPSIDTVLGNRGGEL